jgi:hypothetical protein
MIAFLHPAGIVGEWWWADPTLSVGRLNAIEHGVYRWRLETLRALIIERLKEGE